MLLVVWWSWNYTTWVTNELDPESIVVRLLLIGLMLRQLPDGGGDPGGVRRPRAAVRGRLRGDPGRPAHVPDVRRGGRGNGRARARRADPDLVHRRRRAVDRRRAGRRPDAHDPVADRAGDRLRRAAVHVLRARACAGCRCRPGTLETVALRRALPALRDPRAGRVDRRHRRDRRGRGARRRAARRLLGRLPRHRGDVVAVLQLRRGDRPAAARAGSRTARSWRATPTPTCTS